MGKKSKIDFIIHEDDFKKIVFRFLPKQSSCHSFSELPPTKWEEVYKVYYSYKIFVRWKKSNYTYEVFDSGCDECSIIDEVASRINYIIEGKQSITVNYCGEDTTIELLDSEMLPFGDGVSWIINKGYTGYQFVLWNSNAVGYRFYLENNRLKKFGDYLTKCCEYMLAHGDPI